MGSDIVLIGILEESSIPVVSSFHWGYPIYHNDLTRFNKIAIQGTPQMAVDKEAIIIV